MLNLLELRQLASRVAKCHRLLHYHGKLGDDLAMGVEL